MKIKIIIPYFGGLPVWIDLFMDGCRSNPSIDWLLIGDFKPIDLPINVEHVHMTLEEVKQRIVNCIGVIPDHFIPYKFCDYKPLYGLIFSDFLNGVDYWAHSDMDLVYGDLEHHVNPHHLEGVDIYSPYDRSCGHLQFYRNCDKVNRFFLNLPQLENYLKCPYTVNIDEPAFDLLLEGNHDLVWKRLECMKTSFQSEFPFLGATIEPDGRLLDQDVVMDVSYKRENAKVYQYSGDTQGVQLLYLHWYKWKDLVVWQGLIDEGKVSHDSISLSANLFNQQGECPFRKTARFLKPIIYYILFYFPCIHKVYGQKAYAHISRLRHLKKAEKIRSTR